MHKRCLNINVMNAAVVAEHEPNEIERRKKGVKNKSDGSAELMFR
jgi:hypothetical protein